MRGRLDDLAAKLTDAQVELAAAQERAKASSAEVLMLARKVNEAAEAERRAAGEGAAGAAQGGVAEGVSRMPLISKETLTKIWAPDPFEPDPWAWARGWHRRVWHWAKRNPRTALLVGSLSVGVALLALLIADWNPYKAQREAFAPLFTLVAGLAIAGVTLMRHFAQTEADQQRRLTESFSKAVEQLASDKIEARLGGIYTLERLAMAKPRCDQALAEASASNDTSRRSVPTCIGR